MAQRKTGRRFSEQRLGLHRRQLFDWIGSDLEKDRALSADKRADTYIHYLEHSLGRGLWLKKPRVKDSLGGNSEFDVTFPICCFTETTLDEIEFHNREYGRLGLGFPKRFVLRNGGKPVNYINDTKADPSFRAWNLLRQRLTDDRLEKVLSLKELKELQEEFAYLSQFLKRIKHPYSKKEKPKTQKQLRDGEALSSLTRKKKPVSFKRNYGGILHFLEEREWRIVVQETANKAVRKSFVKNGGNSGPPWYLPYAPAKDLFTIVFPDNRTLAKALDNTRIRKLVHAPKMPPVTLLSLEDLGTF